AKILVFDKESGELKPFSEYNGGTESFKHDEYAVRPFYLQFADGMRQPPDFQPGINRAACGDGMYYLEILGCKAKILDRIECIREAPLPAGNMDGGMPMGMPLALPLQEMKNECANGGGIPVLDCGTIQKTLNRQGAMKLPFEPGQMRGFAVMNPGTGQGSRGKDDGVSTRNIETRMPAGNAEGTRPAVASDIDRNKFAGKPAPLFYKSDKPGERNAAQAIGTGPEKTGRLSMKDERAGRKEKTAPARSRRADAKKKGKLEKIKRGIGKRGERGILAETIMKGRKEQMKTGGRVRPDKEHVMDETARRRSPKIEKNGKTKGGKSKSRKGKEAEEGRLVIFTRKRPVTYLSKESAGRPPAREERGNAEKRKKQILKESEAKKKRVRMALLGYL
ncbi:hypothetical protein H0O02_00945, partial [Candidatus Micrarchaeota archaeon]|nr:hypothetical protein [Candidatus Micrarchaeota archaeon]